MSLFGAMTSGVSGLVAQSSAMGAIADNITNVNTVGYKNTHVQFESLVTKQTSSSFYSAGGVRSRPRSANDIQGLLQATSSQTDIAISGGGFFVVNEASDPGNSDRFSFTRAGSFFQDSEGFLRNTAGYYLQAWPTDADGDIILPNDSPAGSTNQNIISTDFLETVNLSRVRGTASSTDKIALGANLPANDPVGAEYPIDIQFFDTLGNTNDIGVVYQKTAANQWDVRIEPPRGTAVVNIHDAAGDIYQSVGQLEFTAIPDAGQSVIIGGTTYSFVAGAAVDNQIQVDGGRTLNQVIADLVDQINNDLLGTPASVKSGSAPVLLITGDDVNPDISVDPNGVSAGGVAATRQTTAFSVQDRDNTGPAVTFNSDGLPSAFNISHMAVLGFESGAADMDDVNLDADPDIDVRRVQLSFGTIGEADGLTQFGADFAPTFIDQNGARFGTFSGVSIGADGLMVALFDNGERRPIYQVPVATFVNPHGLQTDTGNVWNVSEASGDPILLTADTSGSGQVVQASLESSTVDIGEEFTNMIVVQRAYSAATRIISTADEMLEELVRIKR